MSPLFLVFTSKINPLYFSSHKNCKSVCNLNDIDVLNINIKKLKPKS